MKTEYRVGIIYHYFAHYRQPIIKELLQSKQFDFIFFADTEDPFSGGIVGTDMSLLPQFIRTPCRLLLKRFLWQSNIINVGRNNNLDAIIYLGDAQFLSSWISSIISRLMGKKVFFWTHGWVKEEKGFKKYFRNTFYKISNALFLYGNGAKNIGLSYGFAPEKLVVIYNSLNYELQRNLRDNTSKDRLLKLRSEYFDNPNLPLVICTSRLVAVRGLDQLIKALGLLSKEGHKCNLMLVGDGPLKSELAQLAAYNQIDICLYGECYDEEVLSGLIMAANVTVAPGKVGLTAIHSLAYGTPVITHNDANNQMPEWESITAGENGAFFEFGNINDLARAIKEWTLNSGITSDDVRKKCYEIIDKFYNPNYQVQVIENTIAEFLEGKNNG